MFVIIGAIVGANDAGKSDISQSKFRSIKWVEQNDRSYLVPGYGNTFKYYKDKNNLTDYYYTGHYKLYIGEEAIDYVVNDLSDYEVTKSEINDFIDRNEEYTKENFVCLVLENEECIIGGKNTAEKTVTTPYYGFYIKDNSGREGFDIANMNTATNYLFMPEY